MVPVEEDHVESEGVTLVLNDGEEICLNRENEALLMQRLPQTFKVLSTDSLGGLVYTPQQLMGKSEELHTLKVPRGGGYFVILDDGTKVWLNSHTKLNYKSDYGVKERSVSLSGEAYFEVSKDTLRRFLVNAGDMEVEALGTAFNVKAYEEDDEVVTTLFEGSVRTVVGKEFVILSPDESAVFNKSSHILSVNHPTNASYARLWRTNELVFSGESLEEIAVLLNRMYNVEVRFLSNKIKGYSFSGVIRNNSLDNVFEIISLTAPITYVSVGDTIYLNEK